MADSDSKTEVLFEKGLAYVHRVGSHEEVDPRNSAEVCHLGKEKDRHHRVGLLDPEQHDRYRNLLHTIEHPRGNGLSRHQIMLWLIAAILTFFGLGVLLEFGLAIPRSGGQKNYLERVYRHPKYLATCVLAAQMILLGFSSGNALAFGRYVLYVAGDRSPDGCASRGIAIACITFAVALHSVLPVRGLRLGNVLGVFSLVLFVRGLSYTV